MDRRLAKAYGSAAPVFKSLYTIIYIYRSVNGVEMPNFKYFEQLLLCSLYGLHIRVTIESAK